MCFIFKLIIGIQYKDFRFAFAPSEPSPGWEKICSVSLRYVLIQTSISIVGSALEKLAFFLPFGEYIALCLAIVTGLLQIYAISFVVNRSYGNVRLSLIKTDMLEKA